MRLLKWRSGVLAGRLRLAARSFSNAITGGCTLLIASLSLTHAQADSYSYADLDSPAHQYWSRPLEDPFTPLIQDLESGRMELRTSSEKAFLSSLLNALDIPESSQLLVYSTTSLQLRLISVQSPRAIYFNEDIYLGYVRGGRIEVISIDPRLGGIFYIFDIARGRQPIRVERSDECMNCHASGKTGGVPGVVIKSTLPGRNRGSINSFRRDKIGHQVALSERFGGWYITGAAGFDSHWGNRLGYYQDGKIRTVRIEPGQLGNLGDYPRPTSGIVPHLVFEHQAGFANRVAEAAYRTRSYLHRSVGETDAGGQAGLEAQAERLVSYLLFNGEAALPAGGFRGDPDFRRDFSANRRVDSQGRSLKDFDLRERLFRYRCSYMIYSRGFLGLPDIMRTRIYARLKAALEPGEDPVSAHLPAAEKAAILDILRQTHPDLPPGW